MKEQRTTSMLSRVPVILAVTAASYGLPLDTQRLRAATVTGNAMSAPAGALHARPMHQRLTSRH